MFKFNLKSNKMFLFNKFKKVFNKKLINNNKRSLINNKMKSLINNKKKFIKKKNTKIKF